MVTYGMVGKETDSANHCTLLNWWNDLLQNCDVHNNAHSIQ
jgi:hypothetical protein